MRFWVGVTDNDWFHFLRDQPDIDEVNFWQPSGGREFRFKQGDLFLFKLHSPLNYITGGGFFIRFDRFPHTWAWQAFGRKNGAPTFEQMKRRIEKYRRGPVGPADQIGCIILGQPFFWDEADWIPSPPDFAKNIVQVKTYDSDSSVGRDLWERVMARLQASAPPEIAEAESAELVPLYSEPKLRRVRLGQGAFSALITGNYQRRCAVTGEKALPVLDAAHILPVHQGGQHSAQNGLLLRTDVHRLFDAGYVTVTPAGHFLVSRRIKEDFDNGEPYMPFNDQPIWMPQDSASQPDRRFLEWHADEVFLR